MNVFYNKSAIRSSVEACCYNTVNRSGYIGFEV